MAGKYNLFGRAFYLRKSSLYGLGLRIHIHNHGMKDYFDPTDKMAYLVTEARDEGNHLLIPMVDAEGNDRGYYRYNKDKVKETVEV